MAPDAAGDTNEVAGLRLRYDGEGSLGRCADVSDSGADAYAASPCVTGYASSVNTRLPVLRTNGTVVMHSSNVTADETWAGDGTVHVIPNPISIIAPATVTIGAAPP